MSKGELGSGRGSGHAWDRLSAALRQAREGQRRRNRERTRLGRILTAGICVLAGLMIIASAINARGTDLRPGRDTDLVSLVESQSRRNAELAKQVTDLREQVDELTARQNTDDSAKLQGQTAMQAGYAGVGPVVGPAVTVTLDDAPIAVAANGIDDDLLVVHQQDIQAVVNVLWSAGAEAITVQGQRVIATTGIKCVGNTVVLHGIPYAPPYRISAIGDQVRIHAALNSSPYLQIYQQYVAAYRLGYQVNDQAQAEFPAYQGSMELSYASVYRPDSPTPSSSGEGPH